MERRDAFYRNEPSSGDSSRSSTPLELLELLTGWYHWQQWILKVATTSLL
jgi:hypothetical protein